MKKIVYCALAFMLMACGGSNEMPPASNDFAVVTVQTSVADLNTSYPATIKGIQDTEIRPKVAGHITKVCIDEGAAVRKGQVLFVIDPTQYAAAVKQAQAAVEVVKANISTQKITVENKKMLLSKNIISQYDYDVAANQLKSLEAQLMQAEAALVNAKDQLSFCSVTSPADGVVGTIPYRVGSLVSGSTQKPLTTVSNIKDMYVYFSMTEKQLLSFTKEQGGVKKAMEAMPELTLKLADGSEYAHKGHVTAISGVIEQATGSVQIRSTFSNAEEVLRSGGTGAILVPVHQENAIMVPQSATFDIQNKKFVYVVKSDNTVEPREILTLVQNDGKEYVVVGGLSAGERIVVEGVNQLKAGTKINPITPEQSEKNRKAAEQALKDGKMPGEK